MRRLTLIAFAAGLFSCLAAQPGTDDKYARWEKDIAAFEKKDQEKAPPQGAVLFAGSSSIRLWKVEKSFPDVEVINRGFGGSQIDDSTHFAPRIILKYRPRVVVFYAGDNDVAAGKKPEQVLADFKAFAEVVHKELPKTKTVFISIKPSIARAKLLDTQKQANALVEEFCKTDKRLVYLDVVKPMLDGEGKPKPELFVKDGLHLSEAGYELWTALLKPHLK